MACIHKFLVANAYKLHVKLARCIFRISDRKEKNIGFYPIHIFWLSLSKEWGSESPIITIIIIAMYSGIWKKSTTSELIKLYKNQ